MLNDVQAKLIRTRPIKYRDDTLQLVLGSQTIINDESHFIGNILEIEAKSATLSLC